MDSVNATNNEIHAHVSKLDISGDEQIESERDTKFSHRKKVMQDSEFKNSTRKDVSARKDVSNRKNH